MIEDPKAVVIGNDETLFQVCCGCGMRHALHFHVVRGKEQEDDAIYLSMTMDEVGTKLLKFYERHKKKNPKGGKKHESRQNP